MLFHTSEFFIFFGIFFLFYLFLSRHLYAQNILILAGSYLFYAAWDERFLALIVISTVTDYLAGLGAAGKRISLVSGVKASLYLLLICFVAFYNTFSTSWIYLVELVFFLAIGWLFAYLLLSFDAKIQRKAWLAASLIVNLGLLGVFKYFDFFAESLIQFGEQLGVDIDWVTLSIVLPVGISFYTFQTLSYTIDTYKKRMQPTERFIELAAYVAFFPQLVAGPIERAKNLLPQFFEKRQISKDKLYSGLILFFWGMYKKSVIADNLSPLANTVFSNPSSMTSGELWVGLLAFTFQIYCDFSGYSDMARGIARMMGFELMVNFNLPYFSRTPSEFWNRWHISLSSWLRDYLYFSLGGNRAGTFFTYRNLMLTMILGGLWHGAAWNFILWGFYQGTILVIYRFLMIDEQLKKLSGTSLQILLLNLSMGTLFFLLTMLGWLIFRAENLTTIIDYLHGLLALPIGGVGMFKTFIILVTPLLIIQLVQKHYRKLEVFHYFPFFIRYNLALVIFCSLLWLNYQGTVEFIYFDF